MKLLKTILFIFFLIISTQILVGQAIITKTDSIPFGKDSIVILTIPKHRGEVVWQQSLDLNKWVASSKFFNRDSIQIDLGMNASYRAVIFENSCDSIYSDTVKIDIGKRIRANWVEETRYPDSTGQIITLPINGDTLFIRKVNGEYIYQGDIILNLPNGLKGAGLMNSDNCNKTLGIGELWQDNTVYYSVNSNIPDRSKIDLAISNIENSTYLYFIDLTGKEKGNNNYIEFIKDTVSNSSNLGMIGNGKQIIKLYNDNMTGKIIHEIGHAIGLIHEHSRPTRNNYIELNLDNLIPDAKGYENIAIYPCPCKTYGELDFGSIMIYDGKFPKGTKKPDYVKDISEPIMYKRSGGTWEAQREGLSWNDVEIINQLYPRLTSSGKFTDTRNGIRTYNWIRIGTQTWMAENLAYLPAVYPAASGSLSAPYYYVYSYNSTSAEVAKLNSNYIKHGVLYNWPAARNACPSGWHLPSDAEWKQLEIALGMTQSQADMNENYRGTQGAKLKSSTGWTDNGNGTNSAGFNALPSGFRNDADGKNGWFDMQASVTGFWTSTTDTKTSAPFMRGLDYRLTGIARSSDTSSSLGFSVRCVKD